MISLIFLTLSLQALYAFGGTEAFPDFCKLDPDPGFCKAYFRQHFYNATAKKCEEFIYGGCQGNKNNFDTLEECESACGQFSSPFSPPPFVKCGQESCSFYGICNKANRKRKCACYRPCPFVYSPLCGSDGKTYSNQCEMQIVSCLQRQWIYKIHEGACDCSDASCKFGGKCRVEKRATKCQCSQVCPMNYDPICGDDGENYANICLLKIAECEGQKKINYDKGTCR